MTSTLELNLWRLGKTEQSYHELDWGASQLTWKRLNTEMIQEVETLSELLDPSPGNDKPELELRKYLRNYEKLQVALGDIEQSMMCQPSQVAQLQDDASAVNSARHKMKRKLQDMQGESDSVIASGVSFDQGFGLFSGNSKTMYRP